MPLPCHPHLHHVVTAPEMRNVSLGKKSAPKRVHPTLTLLSFARKKIEKEEKEIVRRSPPRHSPPQMFTTPSVKSDVHHPQFKIRRSPPQTFTTPCVKSDVHHPRRSPPQTFTTSDVHHPRHSPPQTFTTPYSKMRHSPPTNISHPLQSSPPKENSPTVQAFKMFLQSKQPCTRAVEGSPSSG